MDTTVQTEGGQPRRIELVVIAVVFAITTLLSYHYQTAVVAWNDCPPGGGEDLVNLAGKIAQHAPLTGAAPYVYRVGTPALVAWLFPGLLPDRALAGFLIVNLVAAGLGVLLLDVWLAMHVRDWRIRTTLVVAFIAMWHAPPRLIFYYPATTDPWLFVFLMAGLIGLERYANTGRLDTLLVLTVLVFGGVFFKEVMVVVGVAALFASPVISPPSARSARISWARLAPLAGSAVALLIVRLFVFQHNPFSFRGAVVDNIVSKSPFTYLLAWFIAFGPMVALLVFDWRRSLSYLRERQHLAAFGAAIAVLAWIGGSETERILSWAMPVVLALIGRVIEANSQAFDSVPLVTTFAFGQLLAERVFWPIPSPSLGVPEFTIHQPLAAIVYSVINRVFIIDDFHWNLWSYFGSKPFHTVALVMWMTFSVGMLLWLRRQRHEVNRYSAGPLRAS
jgi:hypothetical protein